MEKEKTNSIGPRKWEIRDYRPGDEFAITTLFERAFGKRMGATESLEHWRWEYLENPLQSRLIKLAWDGPRLVGHYAASPRRVRLDGHDVIAALSLDTMTDPEYGRLGVFVSTAEALYNDQTRLGQVFVYGFPNANSIHGITKRLRWRRIMPTPVHVRPINPTSFLARRLPIWLASVVSCAISLGADFASKMTDRCPQTGNLILREEGGFGSWANNLWERCCDQHRVWLIRDYSYLNWRYGHRPENTYHVVTAWRGEKAAGYVVMTIADSGVGRTCFVLDLVADVKIPGALAALVAEVVAYAARRGVDFASALLTPGCRYRSAFRQNLFLPLPEVWFPKEIYFGARAFDSSVADVLFDRHAWSISWGDNDVL